MNKAVVWPVVAVLVVGLGVILFLRFGGREAPPPEPPPAAQAERSAEQPPEKPEPPPEFVPEAPAEAVEPLPSLDESDAELRERLAEASEPDLLERFLVPEGLVRKLVATVDNLPRQKVDMRVRAVTPVTGPFLVEEDDDRLVLDEDNFRRYGALVKLVAEADAEQLADLYVRYYPLLQEAYRDLGYPDQQFHNRLLDVIDDLLATPKVEGPIRLVRPHVLYQYADPELEKLSAGQKAMLRLGPDNGARIKDKLREVREVLVARSPDTREEDAAEREDSVR